MKKLCNGKGRRVHPSPPTPATAAVWDDQLVALPAAVLALAAALTPEEQEVLTYLLAGYSVNSYGGGRWREQQQRRWLRQHPPELGCRCFGCYKSFWARWDASPNRHVIHNIIDAVEESVELREQGQESCHHRRRGRRRGRKGSNLTAAAVPEESSEAETKTSLELVSYGDGDDEVDSRDDDDSEEDGGEKNNGESNANEKSSVRRFVSFIGERVWKVWN